MGMCRSFTTKPMKPMTMIPIPVARHVAMNSSLVGLVHFSINNFESLANWIKGAMMTSLTSLMLLSMPGLMREESVRIEWQSRRRELKIRDEKRRKGRNERELAIIVMNYPGFIYANASTSKGERYYIQSCFETRQFAWSRGCQGIKYAWQQISTQGQRMHAISCKSELLGEYWRTNATTRHVHIPCY